jgi:hypothetical protein
MRLTMNAVPVGFDRETLLRVGRVSQGTKDDLARLRNEYRGVHLVRRGMGNWIEVVARTSIDPPGTRSDVKAGAAPHVVVALVQEWLLDYLLAMGRPVARRRQTLVLVSTRPEDDLLGSSLPAGLSLPGWLGVRVAFDFDSRLFYRGDGGQDVALVCGVHSRVAVDASVSDLLGHGVEVLGLYVRRNEVQDDPRLLPRRGLVGRVRERSTDDRLVLDDHIEGVDSIAPTEAFPEPRGETVDRLVRALHPASADEILRRYEERRAELASGPERLRRLQKIFEYIRGEARALTPELKVSFGELMASKRPRFPQFEVIEKPDLIFDVGGRKTNRWNQGGLDKYGPSDRYQFTPKNLNIAVICQARAKGRVETFVERLLNGLPNTMGFLRRYALDRPYVRFFQAASAAAKDYRSACVEALEHVTDQGKRWHLALVQIDAGMEGLRGDENPYLVTKAFFLARNVAVQDVELETMEQFPQQLVYSLNNIGLASYAKLGGVPWLLPADQVVAHELVIGLGSYETSESRLGGRERLVGITTVFTGDGRYLLESRTRAVPFADYGEEMLRTIRRAVNEVKQEQNWQTGEPIRLVFHAFKPLKDAEVEAVKELMNGLGYPHADFAFVHVADSHPLLVFDEAQPGAPAPRGTKKGVMAPPRGLRVTLSGREVLLAFKGASEVKQSSDGLPRPVLLRLHRDSTFQDMTYIGRQAFAFSCHSWRSFFPSAMPITILYSQLMAEKLRLLQDVKGWSSEDILGPIGRTRWFL